MRVTAADAYCHLPVDSNGRLLIPDSVLTRSIACALCTQDDKIIDVPFSYVLRHFVFFYINTICILFFLLMVMVLTINKTKIVLANFWAKAS